MICTNPLISTEVPFSQPHHSQDLIGRYGVSPTATKVARTDPVTGEKINKLRSSYQNHIKAFQIAGRNKPIKHDDAHHGMSLRDIAAWPEEEWRNQKVASKEVSKGLSNTTLAKVDKAVKLEPGPVPKNDEWESILGHEKPKPAVSPNEPDSKPGAQERRLGKVNGHMNGPSAGENEIIRARRTGKRRRYDDDSFEGYGEGYVDDDRDDVDSSDGGTKKKRRRKVIYVTPEFELELIYGRILTRSTRPAASDMAWVCSRRSVVGSVLSVGGDTDGYGHGCHVLWKSDAFHDKRPRPTADLHLWRHLQLLPIHRDSKAWKMVDTMAETLVGYTPLNWRSEGYPIHGADRRSNRRSGNSAFWVARRLPFFKVGSPV
jgi:hypothetical protein